MPRLRYLVLFCIALALLTVMVNVVFDPQILDLHRPGTSLFRAPNRPEQAAFVAELGIDAILPRGFTRPENFKIAGDRLIGSLGDGNYDGVSDRIFFPAIYCYRHAIETQLKELIRSGLRYEVNPGDPNPAGHQLQPLWLRSKTIILAAWENPDQALLGLMEGWVGELSSVDESGQAIRYAQDRRGVDNNLPLPDRVDLHHLRSVMNTLWWFLSSWHQAVDGGQDLTKFAIIQDNGEIIFSPMA